MREGIKMTSKGTLYLVGTPIGNLEDMTLRGVRILKEVGCIAAEDTRRTQKLLNHFSIQNPVTSYHEHNAKEKGRELLKKLLEGISIALVTDAGMPTLSDPGFELVREALENSIPVTVIPGGSALTAALAVSGMSVERFAFEGFLPSRSLERRRRLQELKNEKRTLVFFEAPHRIQAFLSDCLEILGDRSMALCRELTKQFEETLHGKIGEIVQKMKKSPRKGEMTVVIEGPIEEEREPSLSEVHQALEEERAHGSSLKEAVENVSDRLRMSRRKIYQQALHLGIFMGTSKNYVRDEKS
jgi:16S rRNA (cytidine1402-2'-O)-methyltransferase